MMAPESENVQARLPRYSMVAAIVGPIVGVAIALLAWLYPQAPSLPSSKGTESSEEAEAFTLDRSRTLALETDQFPSVEQARQSSPNAVASSVPPVQSPPGAERPVPAVHPDPIIFSLGNGEQRVFSHGDLSVSSDFTQIGDTVVPTLHLQARGKEPEDHALLTGGGRFEVTVGSKTFVVLVLRVDSSTRTFELQVDLRE